MSTRELSEDAWQKVEAPFCYLKREDGEFAWDELVSFRKWADQTCGGWYFVLDNKTIVFEQQQDAVLFRVWIESK